MKHKFLNMVLLFLSFFLFSCASQNVPLPKESTLITEVLKTVDVPALSGAVIKNGEVEFIGVEGFRVKNKTVQALFTDSFNIGSNTESMIALLAGMLVDDKKIEWSSTIGEILFFMPMDAAYKNVTLEMLLSHTSGIPGTLSPAILSTFLNAKNSVSIERKRMTLEALALKPLFKRGESFYYSNLGYVVATFMLETVSGKDWESLAKMRLFTPLGMIHSGFGPQETSETSIKSLWPHNPLPVSPGQFDSNPLVIGTATCSISDMASYILFLLNEGKTKDGKPLISKSSFNKIFTEVMRGYALGWIVEKGSGGELVASYNGSGTYFYSSVFMIPGRKYAVIALTNQGDETGLLAVKKLLNLFITHYEP